jgi:hypothetical protein
VRKKRRETGQGYVGILRGLPGDARRWADQTKDRAARALEEGKAAARDRDAEFARQLEAASSPSDL